MFTAQLSTTFFSFKGSDQGFTHAAAIMLSFIAAAGSILPDTFGGCSTCQAQYIHMIGDALQALHSVKALIQGVKAVIEEVIQRLLTSCQILSE